MPKISLHRLYHQKIAASHFQSPSEVVAWLGAIQAQDYTGAKWSIGLRLPQSTDSTIETAITQKSVLRTWVMRGTLHFVAAADIRWIVNLVAPRLISGNTRRYAELELDEPTLIRSSDLLANALQDGQQLTRPELFNVLEEAGISTKGQRGVYMLQRASLEGLICQGIAVKNVPTFLGMDNMPPAPSFTREEALAELAKRYFTSHAPATLPDFLSWSGLLTAEAKTGLEAVKGAFTPETLADQTYYWSDSANIRELPTPTAYLISGFDEYFLGYRDRSPVMDLQYFQRVVPGGNGVFYPMIVIDGQIVGTWKKVIKKGVVNLLLDPFNPLTEAELEAIRLAAVPYGEFLEMPVNIS